MRVTSQRNRTAALLALIVVAAAIPDPASAAVAVCKSSHSGEAAEDRSEVEAKRRALESWTKGARAHGEQFARWGIAFNRHIDCTRSKPDLFRCQASGRPCTVQQVPSDDLVPLGRVSR
jgi:hypothetical protein